MTSTAANMAHVHIGLGEQLVSLSEAARRLAVSVRTLERLINRGDLHVVRIVGRGRGARRVTEAELARLITAGAESHAHERENDVAP